MRFQWMAQLTSKTMQSLTLVYRDLVPFGEEYLDREWACVWLGHVRGLTPVLLAKESRL